MAETKSALRVSVRLETLLTLILILGPHRRTMSPDLADCHDELKEACEARIKEVSNG